MWTINTEHHVGQTSFKCEAVEDSQIVTQ